MGRPLPYTPVAILNKVADSPTRVFPRGAVFEIYLDGGFLLASYSPSSSIYFSEHIKNFYPPC